MEVFAPATIADRCVLPEAILWVLVGEVPLVHDGASKIEENERFNGETGQCSGYYVDLEYFAKVSSVEIGLRRHPAEKFDHYELEQISFHTLEIIDADPGSTEWEQLRSYLLERYDDEELVEAREAFKDYNDWLDEFEVLLEVPKARILTAVLTGAVPVFCANEIEHTTLNETDEELDPAFVDHESSDLLVAAPKEAIRAASIDWQRSESQVGDLRYHSLCLDTHALMAE